MGKYFVGTCPHCGYIFEDPKGDPKVKWQTGPARMKSHIKRCSEASPKAREFWKTNRVWPWKGQGNHSKHYFPKIKDTSIDLDYFLT